MNVARVAKVGFQCLLFR